MLPRGRGYRLPPGRALPDVSMPGLAGGMISVPYDMGGMPLRDAGMAQPIPIGALASALANASPTEQRTVGCCWVLFYLFLYTSPCLRVVIAGVTELSFANVISHSFSPSFFFACDAFVCKNVIISSIINRVGWPKVSLKLMGFRTSFLSLPELVVISIGLIQREKIGVNLFARYYRKAMPSFS